jgi:hypothetical protein
MRPRIRTVKPEFFGDRKVRAISEPARFTAIGLICAADDRGRAQRLIPELRGFIYPSGDVSERGLQKRLEEILGVGIAVGYEVDGERCLWLPNFWRHQVINRPTESLLPAHPEDPYGDLPVVDALKKFREDSLINHGGLTPSRGGARFPRSSSLSLSSSTNNVNDSNGSRKPSRTVDQNALPSSLPAELHDTASSALGVLLAVQGERGGDEPTLRGVGLAVGAYPNRDHAGVVRDLEHWALAGNGQNREVLDWAKTYRTFLRKAPAGKATTVTNGHGNGHLSRREQLVADRNRHVVRHSS